MKQENEIGGIGDCASEMLSISLSEKMTEVERPNGERKRTLQS